MKLTEEQITYIENYIKSFDIKYYEVYMEILDHMILSVEAILEEHKEIVFEDAVLKAKNQFGQQGFKKFSKEKLESFRQSERKMYGNEIKKYVTFPKIVLTVIGYFGLVIFLGYFEKPKKIALSLILFFCVLALYQLKFWYQNRKMEGFKLIKNEFYLYGINSVVMWTYFNNIFDNENTSIYAKLFFSLTITMSFLSLLIFIKTRKLINAEIKSYLVI